MEATLREIGGYSRKSYRNRQNQGGYNRLHRSYVSRVLVALSMRGLGAVMDGLLEGPLKALCSGPSVSATHNLHTCRAWGISAFESRAPPYYYIPTGPFPNRLEL